MEAMTQTADPVYLLVVGLCALSLLILLIIKFKLHAFAALY